MQCMSALGAGCTVQIVVIKGVSDMRQMNAYLVRTPGKEAQTQQCFIFVAVQYLVGSFGVFAVFADAALDDAAFLTGNGCFDNA